MLARNEAVGPVTAAERLLNELRPGETVYLPGASGEALALGEALRGDPARAAGVHFIGCLVPGMNETVDYAGLTEDTRVTTYLLPRCMRQSFVAGRVSLLPLTYHGAAMHLASAPIDTAIAHVAPPDDDGNCSLGIASDFAALVWPHARRRILVINPEMPALPRALKLRRDEADVAITLGGPLVTAPADTPTPVADDIARRVAALIPDGAHLQTGIGGAPGAVWRHLGGHRALTARSGMATEGLRDLAEAGALAEGGDHLAGIAYGSPGFYEWLRQSDKVRFATTLETHSIAALAQVPRLHSVNGALGVDLFGQANVEWQGMALSSGVGGGPDFMRGAACSPGGRSILALPSTAKGGTISRIVARLNHPTVGIARSDVDTVVTEHGVAELRDKGLDQRADALIAIAAPQFRDALSGEWRLLRRSFSV